MQIGIRIDGLAGRGGGREHSSDVWAWPLSFVLDDRALPSVLSGEALDDELVIVGAPLQLGTEPQPPTIGRPQLPLGSPQAELSFEAHANFCGNEFALVGVALVLTLGDPRSEAVIDLVAERRAELQAMLGNQARLALQDQSAKQARSAWEQGTSLTGGALPALVRLQGFDAKPLEAALDALLDAAALTRGAALSGLGRALREPALDVPTRESAPAREAAPPGVDTQALPAAGLSAALAGASIARLGARTPELSRTLATEAIRARLAVNGTTPPAVDSTRMVPLQALAMLSVASDRAAERLAHDRSRTGPLVASLLRIWRVEDLLKGPRQIKNGFDAPQRRLSYSVLGSATVFDELEGSPALLAASGIPLALLQQRRGGTSWVDLRSHQSGPLTPTQKETPRAGLSAAWELPQLERAGGRAVSHAVSHAASQAHLVWLSEKQELIHALTTDARTWSTRSFASAGTSQAAPALALAKGTLGCAFFDDGKLHFLRAERGGKLTKAAAPKLENPAELTGDIGLGALGPNLLMALPEKKGRMQLWIEVDGRSWKQQPFPCEDCIGRPTWAAAESGKLALLAFRTGEGGIVVASGVPGKEWKSELVSSSVLAVGNPSLAGEPASLLVAFRGLDGNCRLFQRQSSGDFQELSALRDPTLAAGGDPALLPLGKETHLCWVTTQGRLAHGVIQGTVFKQKPLSAELTLEVGR